MHIPEHIKDSLERLSQEELIVLGLFAYAFGDCLSESDIERTMKKIKKTKGKNSVNNPCDALKEKGFIIKEDGFFWRYETMYTLVPRYFFNVVFYFKSEAPDILATVMKTASSYMNVRHMEYMWKVADAAVNRDMGYLFVSQRINLWGTTRKEWQFNLVRDILPVKDAWPVLISMTPVQFTSTIEYCLIHDFENECQTCSLELLEELGSFYLKSAVFDIDSYLDMIRCFRYLETGHLDSFSKANPSEYRDAALAISSLYKGDSNNAIKFFDNAIKAHNKNSTNKGILSLSILEYFRMLSYAIDGSDESKAKTQSFLNKINQESRHDLFPAIVVASSLILNPFDDKTKNFTASAITYEARMYHSVSGYFMAKLLGGYLQLGEMKDLDELLGSFKESSWAAIRHEMDANGTTGLKEVFGGASLLYSFRRRNNWEIAIDDIMSFLDNKEDKSTVKSSRIVYIIDSNDTVTIEEQKKLKSGVWGMPRPVAASSFYSEDKDSMDNLDKEINRNVNIYNCNKTWHYAQYLVGCDRVFHRPRKQKDIFPVTIAKNKLFLTIDKNKKTGSYTVKANLPSAPISESGINIVKNDPYHYDIFDLSDLEFRIVKTLVKVKDFPAESEDLLKQLLGKLGNKVEMHSSLIEGGSTLDTVEGNTTLSLMISPSGDFYRVAIVARPLADGNLKPIPGKGTKILVDSIGDKRYQVTRDIKTEKERYDRLYTFICNSIETEDSTSEADENVFILPVEGLLDVMSFIQEFPDEYVIEWLEGHKVKIRKKLYSRSVSANLRKKGNWFEIEGDINIDENTVLTIQELLKMYADRRGSKYIKLADGEFMELEESLRKQLRSLNDLSSGKSCHIPMYHVGTLASTVHEKNGILKTDDEFKKMEKAIMDASHLDPEVPDTLQADLRDYQTEGFKWIVRLSEWGAGACLADDMGLGKTVQSIAFLLYRASKGASLVVAPASVILNWASELAKFSPSLNVTILNESDSRKEVIETAGPGDVILCSYAILVREEDALSAHDWNVICLDEAHTIKNRGTKMSAAAMKLKGQARLILTGTPIQNGVMELWNLFQFMNPGLLGSSEQFIEKYITGEHADDNAKRLKQAIKPFILRRRKADVIEELPEKTDIQRSVTLAADELVTYEMMRQKAEDEIANASRVDINTLAQITKLRQASCSMAIVDEKWGGSTSKTDTAVELIRQIVEGGNRVLVFSQFTTFLKMVKDALDAKDVLYLDGSTPIRSREEMVKKFQAGVGKVFFISLKAGGLGLNLTGANYVIHLDPWWNPAIEQQATDRAYRIGQNRSVTVYHLISANTIEEKILRLHKAKKDMADALLEGTDIVGTISLEELKALVSN